MASTATTFARLLSQDGVRSVGYLLRDGPGHLGQEAEHGLGEVLVRDIVLQQEHLRLRALVSCVAQATYKMTLGDGERKRDRKEDRDNQHTHRQRQNLSTVQSI